MTKSDLKTGYIVTLRIAERNLQERELLIIVTNADNP